MAGGYGTDTSDDHTGWSHYQDISHVKEWMSYKLISGVFYQMLI